MIASRIRCVVDASVGIKRVVVEPDSDRTRDLFDHLTSDPAARFFVPDFFYLECANILWKLVKKGSLTIGQASANLATLRSFRLDVVQVTTLVDDALLTAAAHGISAYDAAYVVAAASLGLPLITADDKLVRKLAGTPYQLELLGGLTIPPLPPTAAGS